jgi:hypothetical protein
VAVLVGGGLGVANTVENWKLPSEQAPDPLNWANKS